MADDKVNELMGLSVPDLSDSERLDLAKAKHALRKMSPQELYEFMKGTPDE